MADNTNDVSKKKITRRQAIKYASAAALGAAASYYGLTRSGLLALLDDDAKQNSFPQVAKRKFEATGDEISLLSFGCMRFPIIGRDRKNIDEELAEKMIDYAYRRGVNYFDTAYVYHGGNSERFLGKAMKKYPRESYFIADKMPGWLVQTPDDAKRLFEEQLERCQTDYFDYYMLHSLSQSDPSRSFKRIYEDLNVLNYLKQEKTSGRIRQLGFSFHGDIPLMKYLLNNYKWDFCMIQLNYFDWDLEINGSANKALTTLNKRFYPSATLYKMCEEKNLPCFVMEPLRGGQLAVLNADAVKILKQADAKQTPASWALRYAASFPNVISILSGMSSMKHVAENIATMTDFKPLNEQNHLVINEALTAFKAKLGILCTQCYYCEPCPYGINISGIFKIYNDISGSIGLPLDVNDKNYKKQKKAFLVAYNNSIKKEERADHCTGCGKCVEICPQRIDIPTMMIQVETLANKAAGKHTEERT